MNGVILEARRKSRGWIYQQLRINTGEISIYGEGKKDIKLDIKKLCIMQNDLDTYIAKEKDLGDPYDNKFLEKRKLALLVELGELANATRCFKYWSNKPPESKERILDELADCLHFSISIINLTKTSINRIQNNHEEIKECINSTLKFKEADVIKFINDAFKYIAFDMWGEVLMSILVICLKLGYELAELEQAYIKKHEINYKRQQQGY